MQPKSNTSPGARRSQIWVQVGLWLVTVALLAWVLRTVPLGQVWEVLRGIAAWQVALIFVMSSTVLLLFGARWWVLLRAFTGGDVPYLSAALHRLAGYGVSYFTPGPQVGGEAVQIKLLVGRHGVSAPDAIASISLDRLVEVTMNLLVVLSGLALLLSAQFEGVGTYALGGVVGVLALLLGTLAAQWRGYTPLTAFVRLLPGLVTVKGLVADSESRVVAVLQAHPGAVVAAFVFSILSWTGIALEYTLMARFLGIVLTPMQLLSALTAFQVSFLLPLPGGAGALEGGQVLIYEFLGLDPAVAVGVVLLMRARDVTFGLLGLGWLAYAWRKRPVQHS